MLNLYESIRSSLYYNKFEIRELLFVEYTCPLKDESTGVWAKSDYLVHVLSGKKTWRTSGGDWTVNAGQTLYIKKGAAFVDQFFEEDFCLLAFFISDEFIRNVLKEISGKIFINPGEKDLKFPAVEVQNNVILSTYFHSMLTYFSGNEKPSESLLEIKLKELIINILTSPDNPSLSAYFKFLFSSGKPAIQQIMDANFFYNLSLDEFAELCHRSLSSFKRDFQKLYNGTPGKWLMNKRLDRSAMLLKNSDLNITQIVFECGFEDVSHFSRAFKKNFGVSPIKFRKE